MQPGLRWAIAGGAGAVLVLALGAFLWLRPRTPDAGALVPASQEAAADRTGDSGRGRPSAPSVPAGEPGSSAKPAAGPSVATAPTDDSATTPKADADDEPRAASAGESRRLQLLVPAYIYPSGEGRNEWDRLFKAASKVKIVAIANPNSGPGEERNLEYNAIFLEAAERGVTIVGYVSTDFGKRSQAAIEKDVETWLTFYPRIRGFFFDQQPRDGQSVVRFARLRDYVKRKLSDPVLITNPGVPCDEAYLAQDVSNVTCVFVNFQGFDRFELPEVYKPYDASRFAAMPYDIPDAKTMRQFVRDAIVKRIGYIYVSDAKQPNPWAKLPAYWEEEVDAISRLR